MKWKSEVLVQIKGQCEISSDAEKRTVAAKDEYIVKAVTKDAPSDADLIRIIMEEEQVDSILAGLRLAQFVVDYGEFLEEPAGHMVIEE